MVDLLAKIFIKNHDDPQDLDVRQKYGILCSALAIFFNIALFAAKYLIGIVSSSVSIKADSFNNLSDVLSAVIVLVAFRLSTMKPSPDQPFGHGRIEYVSGLCVSAFIIFMGVELGKTSIEKIIHPEEVTFSLPVVIVLVLSIAAKFYMSLFTGKVAKKIQSTALMATSKDNLSDTFSTSAVLVCTLISHFFDLNLDGYCGTLVSILILRAGLTSGKETLNQLMGSRPDPELVAKIEDIVLSYEEIVGLHDLIIHDYGPGRLIISLHAEVPDDKDIHYLHDAMDRAMAELDEKLKCESVIHMDPISVNDEKTVYLRQVISEKAADIAPGITVHDLRIVEGPTHTNVIFDALVPRDCKVPDEDVKKRLNDFVRNNFEHHFCVIKIDKPYI